MKLIEKTFEYATRPGSLALSMVCFAGLVLLAAFLWQFASGLVLLLFVPALLVSFVQMVLTPIYGLRMDDTAWIITDEDGRRHIANNTIAHLKIEDRGPVARAIIVLTEGGEVEIPFDVQHNPFHLIRAATDRGVPVRTV